MERFGIHDETLAAFTAQPIAVGELLIQPVTLAHLMAMRRVAPNFESGELNQDEMLGAIVVFTTSPEDSAALVSLTDSEWEQRRIQVAGKAMLVDMPRIADAIRAQMNGGQAPALKVESKSEKKTAASAGGSKPTSAASPSTAGRKRMR